MQNSALIRADHCDQAEEPSSSSENWYDDDDDDNDQGNENPFLIPSSMLVDDPNQWRFTDFTEPSTEKPTTAYQGMQNPLPTTAEPIEYWKQLWTDDITERILTETLRYAELKINAVPNEEARQNLQEKWRAVELSKPKLKCYFGTLLWAGYVQLPAWEDYFSNQTGIWQFKEFFSKEEWLLITRFVHFCDNSTIPPDNLDKLVKVRWIIERLKTNFKLAFEPAVILAIDEGMMPYSGASRLQMSSNSIIDLI